MGSLTDDVIERLAARGVVHPRRCGGLRLLQGRDALRAVEECRKGKVVILGIEAFRLLGEHVVPDMDLIADYSDLLRTQQSDAVEVAATAALGYLARAASDESLWFDFCLGRAASGICDV